MYGLCMCVARLCTLCVSHGLMGNKLSFIVDYFIRFWCFGIVLLSVLLSVGVHVKYFLLCLPCFGVLRSGMSHIERNLPIERGRMAHSGERREQHVGTS